MLRVDEPGFFQQHAHRRPLGELLDRGAQIVVSRLFTGDQCGDPGQDVVQIGTVNPAQRHMGHREVEDQHVPAGFQNASHFCESDRPGGHIPQAKRDRDHIEAALLKRQLQAIGDNQPIEPFPPRDFQHRLAEIGSHDDRFRAGFLQGQGQVAAPGCQI